MTHKQDRSSFAFGNVLHFADGFLLEFGIAYGKEELTHPTRIITSTVRAEGCLHSRCPVKTSKPVPKGQMAEVVAALDSVVLHAPIHVGDVVLTDVCGTGVDVVATRDL